jgi:Na+-transporting methylmalonyl-CoA/oxaloacetate decarboxylase gamma subunit
VLVEGVKIMFTGTSSVLVVLFLLLPTLRPFLRFSNAFFSDPL